jgi:protein BCP1
MSSNDASDDDEHSQQRRKRKTNEAPNNKNNNDGELSVSSSSSDEEDEDLVLEGVVIRNPDASDSEEDNHYNDTSGEEVEDTNDSKPAANTSSTTSSDKNNKKKTNNISMCHMKNKRGQAAQKGPSKNKENKKRKKQESAGPEIIPVEFTFCDMNERYFHGLKTLLASSSPLYATSSSAFADLMIENISVGTVISTDADKEEGTVYGFASVLNVTTYQDNECVQSLKNLCLSKCPHQHKKELDTVLSGKTKRPVGFLLQSRMVNLPLEIVEILHQQLVLDMDWAVEHAEGGEEDRKSLNFGAFVRLAPTYRSSGVSYYKYFDDEIFSQYAEFYFEIALPNSFGMEETPYCMVIVMTKTGHRAAMKNLNHIVNGATSIS